MKWIFKYIVVFISLLLTYSGQSQQGSNPFEIIRTSKDQIDTTVTPVGEKGQSAIRNNGNSFEVYRSDDTLSASTPSNITVVDSLSVENFQNTTVEPSEEIDIDADDMDYLSDNPFEVSHVPYRRSELKEQAKKDSNPIATNKKSNTRSIVNVRSTSTNNTFIFWLVLFTLFLLAIVVNVQRNALTKVAKSITNENVLKLSKREENGGLTGHYIMMYVMFFINLACFIFLLVKHFTGADGFSNWLLIFGGVSTIYIVRHISMAFMGNIFNISKDTSLYSFTIMTFNIFLGLMLIPINLVVSFSPTEISNATMYIGIGLILILLLIRIARGLLIGVRFVGEHLFQFFLYLCTFEIAPILILLRILGDQ